MTMRGGARYTLLREPAEKRRLSPSQSVVLNLLRGGPQTTHDLIMGGAGSRYGGRIKELRDMGFDIRTDPLKAPKRRGVERAAKAAEQAPGRSPSAPAPEQTGPSAAEAPAKDAADGRSAAPAEPLFELEPDPGRASFMDYDEEAA